MSTSTITWHPASEPPPDDIDVLLHHPSHSTPVWLGYRNGGRWMNVDAWEIDGSEVMHWAHLPVGPAA